MIDRAHISVSGLLDIGDGFVCAECVCGYKTPPCPDSESVIDDLMVHTEIATIRRVEELLGEEWGPEND